VQHILSLPYIPLKEESGEQLMGWFPQQLLSSAGMFLTTASAYIDAHQTSIAGGKTGIEMMHDAASVHRPAVKNSAGDGAAAFCSCAT
jgi:hypothetical protein